jgi:hypothetical protein
MALFMNRNEHLTTDVYILEYQANQKANMHVVRLRGRAVIIATNTACDNH